MAEMHDIRPGGDSPVSVETRVLGLGVDSPVSVQTRDLTFICDMVSHPYRPRSRTFVRDVSFVTCQFVSSEQSIRLPTLPACAP